jgi:hypothetical protein
MAREHQTHTEKLTTKTCSNVCPCRCKKRRPPTKFAFVPPEFARGPQLATTMRGGGVIDFPVALPRRSRAQRFI